MVNPIWRSSINLRSASFRSHFFPIQAETQPRNGVQRRAFHEYFVTHLPPTSMHPESAGRRHKLPRDESTPHSKEGQSRTPVSVGLSNQDMTVVRIPLQSAKHHFGASTARGTRPYNEDRYQAGTIELPSFAQRQPMSVMDRSRGDGLADGEGTSAEGASGDPQVFYFGVFDGHGGDKCSIWLSDKLHGYVEAAADKFGLDSSLRPGQLHRMRPPDEAQSDKSRQEESDTLQRQLIDSWKETVGGYFRRFQPDHFPESVGGKGEGLEPSTVKKGVLKIPEQTKKLDSSAAIESIFTYSFLRADYDFITSDSDNLSDLKPSKSASDSPEDSEEIFGRHSHHSTSQPFLGGSTCSLAIISTPTPTPFWHPRAPFSILTAHLGDTRILLCNTATGKPLAMTSTHHPSTPSEANRLRRYAAAFTTDSFGEERLTGLANTRAFGDRASKRVGVSAEPELHLMHAKPGEYSFLVLCTDGVTGVLSDQEIVDVVKEANTPEQGARRVTDFAVEVGASESDQGDADNATCVVVRLGGWERRQEGGGGSFGTKEHRAERMSETEGRRRRG